MWLKLKMCLLNLRIKSVLESSRTALAVFLLSSKPPNLSQKEERTDRPRIGAGRFKKVTRYAFSEKGTRGNAFGKALNSTKVKQIFNLLDLCGFYSICNNRAERGIFAGTGTCKNKRNAADLQEHRTLGRI